MRSKLTGDSEVVGVAPFAVWLAVSSELGYYRTLYGPQVLLWLNIAYCTPSIPLLIFQSFFDESLEARLGVARTIFIRLLLGLVGYGLLAACFPFLPINIWALLSVVVALGLFSSIAFSASYQLVARFANKNTIALGLGCSASGPLVLMLQLMLGISGSGPTHRQEVGMYCIITSLVGLGLWATVSLLMRHWFAIEEMPGGAAQSGSGDNGGLGDEEVPSTGLSTPLAPVVFESTPGSPKPRGYTLVHHASLPPLLAYTLLEPFDTWLPDEEEQWGSPVNHQLSSSSSWKRPGMLYHRSSQTETDLNAVPGRPRRPSRSFNSISFPGHFKGIQWGKVAGEQASGQVGPEEVQNETGDEVEEQRRLLSESSELAEEPTDSVEVGRGRWHVARVISLTWPALVSISIQSGIALTLFPFFTYVPSSGYLGENLPKVLFFSRIFADVFGRVLPRVYMLSPTSIWPILVVALLKIVAEPLFFLYIKSPATWHSDVFMVVYVSLMWMGSGFVNTGANMLAPRMVPNDQRSTAAALMAIFYQIGHFVGLIVATVLALLMFGHVGPT